jgi:hypothetical protein
VRVIGERFGLVASFDNLSERGRIWKEEKGEESLYSDWDFVLNFEGVLS